MKKGLKLLLSAAFALSIAGCANGSSNDDKTIDQRKISLMIHLLQFLMYV